MDPNGNQTISLVKKIAGAIIALGTIATTVVAIMMLGDRIADIFTPDDRIGHYPVER
jgi:ABC-type dipeptide/oligopeptide/nickel transport system permease subunit